MDLNYVYCDTDRKVNKAANLLRASSILAFDCEGRDLGTFNGELSLMSFRIIQPVEAAETFLIDTVALRGESLRPIYDIIESDRIKKIVFDGRKDYSCLYHDKGISIRNVVDLQLADIQSRALKGEGDVMRLERLKTILPAGETFRNRHLYDGIHRLSGMKSCAEEHLRPTIQTPRKQTKFDHSLWLERPLTSEYLIHAIEDVVIIGHLYNTFSAAGFLGPQIVDDSLRYVSVWRDRRPLKDELYRNHGLLLLGILDRPQGEQKGKCSFCERELFRSCFSDDGWSSNVRSHATRRKCLVCTAAEKIQHLRDNNARYTRGRGVRGRRVSRGLRGEGSGGASEELHFLSEYFSELLLLNNF